MKKLKLLAFFAIVSVVFFSGCKKDDYVATVGVCPLVVSTIPLDEAVNVPLNQVISVTFNEAMDPATITQESFSIQGTSLSIVGLKSAMVTTPLAGTVTYSGKTATFTPSSPLTPNTAYTGTIKTTVKDLMGNALQVNYVWTFSTDASPSVVSTSPATEASGVPLNKIVTASFSVPMDPTSITALTYTVSQGATLLEGTVAFNGITASFTPTSNLLPNTIYTGTITTGAKNETGTPLAANYVWTFTTGLLPTVTTSIPANNATDIPLDISITATFSMPMDLQTLTGTNVSLKHGTTAVVGTITSTETTVTFNPSSNLLPGTLYTATITTGTENEAGTSLATDYEWSFTTVSISVPTVVSTNPLNNATGITLDKTVTANFSVPMDALTISSSTFTLKQGMTTVPGAVSYSGSTASYNPSANLLPNTLYTATITTGAKNVAGIALAGNYAWSFTTAAEILVAPEVISTDPMDLDTNVALNKTVEATFDVPMNSLSITTNSFTLKEGTNSVVGSVSYSGSTASFNPTSDLLPGTTYTATITTGAENEAGTPLDVDYIWEFTTAGEAADFPLIVDLGSAGDFVVLAGSGISNTGVTTRIIGDVGSFPSATINGLLDGNVDGNLYTTADPIIEEAKNALLAAYNDAKTRSLNAISLPGQLGGLTLSPGLYVNSSTSGISGTGPNAILTLDAQGDPNAVWIFKMGSTLVTDEGTSIVLAGGAQAKNIFWSVGSSATLGTNSVFFGNILADQSITLTTGATLTGRALTKVGAVTLDSNTITKP